MSSRTFYMCDKCKMETTNYLDLYKIKAEKLSNCSPSMYREITFDICEECLKKMFDENQLSEIQKEHQRY